MQSNFVVRNLCGEIAFAGLGCVSLHAAVESFSVDAQAAPVLDGTLKAL